MKQYLYILIAVLATSITSTLIFNFQLNDNLWVNSIKQIEKRIASLSGTMETLSGSIADRKIDIDELIEVQEEEINNYLQLSWEMQELISQKEKISTALFYLDQATNDS